MGRDDNTRFCLDITTEFLGTLLDDEAAEATKGNLLTVDEAFLHCFHETLYYRQNGFLFKTCLLGDLGNNLCFVILKSVLFLPDIDMYSLCIPLILWIRRFSRMTDCDDTHRYDVFRELQKLTHVLYLL